MVTVTPTGAALGAVIDDIDLASKLDDATFKEMRQAFLNHSVLVFRNQHLTPEALIDVTRRFAELEPYESTVAEFLMPDHPEIIMISNIVENGRPIGIREAGQYWHTDRSYVKEPSWGSLLYAVEVPHDDQGHPLGDTMFASMAAAYRDLPDALKHDVDGEWATHQYVYRYTKPVDPLPPVDHPIVARHPFTGVPVLYVNAGFTHDIVGRKDAEGKALLKRLQEHAAKPEHVYRHRWRVGDLVMWDNYATQHNAVGNYDPSRRRLMWRTTMRGVPIAPAPLIAGDSRGRGA